MAPGRGTRPTQRRCPLMKATASLNTLTSPARAICSIRSRCRCTCTCRFVKVRAFTAAATGSSHAIVGVPTTIWCVSMQKSIGRDVSSIARGSLINCILAGAVRRSWTVPNLQTSSQSAPRRSLCARTPTASIRSRSIRVPSRPTVWKFCRTSASTASVSVPQDFDLDVQVAVNRVQSADGTIALIHKARELRIAGLTVDLIYGLPRQTKASFFRTLERVVGVRPNRIAAYSYAHMPHLFKSQRQIKAEHRVDFERYFADELERLAPFEADGLLQRDAHGLRITPEGRLLVRNVAMVFDAHLARSSPSASSLPRYSRVVWSQQATSADDPEERAGRGARRDESGDRNRIARRCR